MFKRGQRTMAMAPVVPLPTGNVEVVTAALYAGRLELPTQAAGERPVEECGWSVRSTDGRVISAGLPSRAVASRLLGVLAAHGEDLPLLVYTPDGSPTGERLG